jgi:putative flippase GtrA
MRLKGHSRAFARYSVVGGVATAAHYSLLTALVELAHWPAPPSAGLGAVLGAQVAFAGNRWFTFAHRGPWVAAWWRFQATAALGAVVSMVTVAVGVQVGLHYLVAQVAGTLLSLLLTFTVNRRWSFGDRPAA